ncbi:nuclear transport factor 2 family protein [Streptomyces sp. NPDC054796]
MTTDDLNPGTTDPTSEHVPWQHIHHVIVEALHRHDLAPFLASVSEDILYEEFGGVTTCSGKRELGDFLSGWLSNVPDMRVDVHGEWASGRSSFMEWTMSGTAKATLDGERKAGGIRFSVRGSTVFEYDAQGLLSAQREYWNPTPLLS